MIAIAYHDGVNEVQGDAALGALLREAAAAPFDRGEWFAGLAEHCGIAPLLVSAADGDARALLPLSKGKPGHLHALANWYSFRYRPLLGDDADKPRLLTALARDLRKHAWRVTLAPLPDEDGSASLLEEAFAAAGWRVQREPCDINHILPVNGRSYAEYLAARPGALRTTLKRKAGKVSVELLARFDPAIWAEYEAIYAQSWKPQEGSPAFLRAFAEQEGAAGRLRMAIARQDGRAIAAQFWTVEGSTAFIHKLAHTEDSKPLSPGTTLSAALFEQVIDRDRVALVDFGTGDDGYKRDWMETARMRFRVDCLNAAAPQSWPHLIKRGLRRNKTDII